jgi:hypothetical protein
MNRLLVSVVVGSLWFGLNVIRAEELPADAQALIDQNKKAVAEIERTAAQQTKAANDKLIADLEKLKITYTKEGKLDEAVAIRDFLRAGAKQIVVNPLPDPGVLTTYRSEVGRVLYFDITGSTHRTIYGTDIYTHDSYLSTAAVHAGVLKEHETGIVKVTILPSHSDFKGTGRNGVSSGSWSGSYDCYKVEPLHAKPAGGSPTSIGIVKEAITAEKANITKEVEAVKESLKKVDSVQGALQKLDAVKDALKK